MQATYSQDGMHTTILRMNSFAYVTRAMFRRIVCQSTAVQSNLLIGDVRIFRLASGFLGWILVDD